MLPKANSYELAAKISKQNIFNRRNQLSRLDLSMLHRCVIIGNDVTTISSVTVLFVHSCILSSLAFSATQKKIKQHFIHHKQEMARRQQGPTRHAVNVLIVVQ